MGAKETAVGNFIRVKVNWTGFVGSPGYTNFNFEHINDGPWTQPEVDAAVAKVQTWLTANLTYLHTSVVTGIDSAVSEHDEQTGDITSFWNAFTVAPRPGTSAATQFTSGAGYCISWTTGGVRNGRRVRGRTFFVPLAGNAYAADGSLDNASLNAWKTAATALTGDSDNVRLGIFAHTPGSLIPDGGVYDVIGANIKDRPAFLTSRRG
jgi:hypothetical protein